MTNKGLIQVIFPLTIALILSYLYIKSQTEDINNHYQAHDILLQLKQEDANLNLHILQSYYGELLHYDSLAAGITQLKTLSRQFNQATQGSPENFTQQKRKLKQFIAHKQELLNQFKSKNSIINNSLEYLPTLTEQLSKQLIKNKANTNIINQLSSLVSNTLTYNVTNKVFFYNKAIDNIQALDSASSNIEGPLKEDVTYARKHAHLILEEKQSIFPIVNQLILHTTSQKITQLITQHDQIYQKKSEQADQYKLYLYLLAIALLTFIGYIMLRLKNRTITLDKTVQDLDYQKFAMDQHAIVCIANADKTVEYVNNQFAEISQYSRKELIGQSLYAICLSNGTEEQVKSIERTITHSRVWHGELSNRKKEGGNYWVSSTIVPFVDESGKPYQYVAIQTDITQCIEAKNELYREKNLAQFTLHAIADGVITTDKNGLVDYINPKAEQLIGIKCAHTQGQPLNQVFSIYDESSNEPVLNLVDICLQKKRNISYSSLLLSNKGGQDHTIEVTASPIRNSDETVSGTVIVFHDITSMHQMTQKMNYQATHDPLTGLINRREFERRLIMLINSAQEHQQEHALCYLDLDQFKIINDTCGHVAGDELLHQISIVMNKQIRERDSLARLGGDEFGILLGECPVQQAYKIAENICHAVKDFRFSWEGKIFEIGVSIGLAPITKQTESLSSITAQSDEACYIAKERGRNRVHIYKQKKTENKKRQGDTLWVPRLTKALSDDRFTLHCQPIQPLQKNESDRHFEILIRMKDEQGILIPPGAFIPAAERYNLMPAIDRWVIQQAFSMIHTALDKNPLLKNQYAINLSAASLNDDKFIEFVKEQFKTNDILPNMFCFEITETTAIANLTKAIEYINCLKDIGCKFSLDNFGSGLSSFTYLKNLPVNYLKIDGTFIRDTIENPIDCAMVNAMNEIGHVMGIQTVAECVESNTLHKKAKELGIDYAQGNIIAYPAPLKNSLEKPTEPEQKTLESI